MLIARVWQFTISGFEEVLAALLRGKPQGKPRVAHRQLFEHRVMVLSSMPISPRLRLLKAERERRCRNPLLVGSGRGGTGSNDGSCASGASLVDPGGSVWLLFCLLSFVDFLFSFGGNPTTTRADSVNDRKIQNQSFATDRFDFFPGAVAPMGARGNPQMRWTPFEQQQRYVMNHYIITLIHGDVEVS